MKIRKVKTLFDAPQPPEAEGYLQTSEVISPGKVTVDALGRPLIDIITPQPKSSSSFRTRIARPPKTQRIVQRKRRIQ